MTHVCENCGQECVIFAEELREEFQGACFLLTIVCISCEAGVKQIPLDEKEYEITQTMIY